MIIDLKKRVFPKNISYDRRSCSGTSLYTESILYKARREVMSKQMNQIKDCSEMLIAGDARKSKVYLSSPLISQYLEEESSIKGVQLKENNCLRKLSKPSLSNFESPFKIHNIDNDDRSERITATVLKSIYDFNLDRDSSPPSRKLSYGFIGLSSLQSRNGNRSIQSLTEQDKEDLLKTIEQQNSRILKKLDGIALKSKEGVELVPDLIPIDILRKIVYNDESNNQSCENENSSKKENLNVGPNISRKISYKGHNRLSHYLLQSKKSTLDKTIRKDHIRSNSKKERQGEETDSSRNRGGIILFNASPSKKRFIITDPYFVPVAKKFTRNSFMKFPKRKQEHAVKIIQSFWRHFITNKKKAGIAIQSLWRGFFLRKNLKSILYNYYWFQNIILNLEQIMRNNKIRENVPKFLKCLKERKEREEAKQNLKSIIILQNNIRKQTNKTKIISKECRVRPIYMEKEYKYKTIKVIQKPHLFPQLFTKLIRIKNMEKILNIKTMVITESVVVTKQVKTLDKLIKIIILLRIFKRKLMTKKQVNYKLGSEPCSMPNLKQKLKSKKVVHIIENEKTHEHKENHIIEEEQQQNLTTAKLKSKRHPKQTTTLPQKLPFLPALYTTKINKVLYTTFLIKIQTKWKKILKMKKIKEIINLTNSAKNEKSFHNKSVTNKSKIITKLTKLTPPLIIKSYKSDNTFRLTIKLQRNVKSYLEAKNKAASEMQKSYTSSEIVGTTNYKIIQIKWKILSERLSDKFKFKTVFEKQLRDKSRNIINNIFSFEKILNKYKRNNEKLVLNYMNKWSNKINKLKMTNAITKIKKCIYKQIVYKKTKSFVSKLSYPFYTRCLEIFRGIELRGIIRDYASRKISSTIKLYKLWKINQSCMDQIFNLLNKKHVANMEMLCDHFIKWLKIIHLEKLNNAVRVLLPHIRAFLAQARIRKTQIRNPINETFPEADKANDWKSPTHLNNKLYSESVNDFSIQGNEELLDKDKEKMESMYKQMHLNYMDIVQQYKNINTNINNN